MAKRRIIATANGMFQKIEISTSIQLDSVLIKSEQDKKVEDFRDALYTCLFEYGFRYKDIKIK